MPNEVRLRELWSGGGGIGALYATVHRLRRKLEMDPPRPTWIVTVPGVGVRPEAAGFGLSEAEPGEGRPIGSGCARGYSSA